MGAVLNGTRLLLSLTIYSAASLMLADEAPRNKDAMPDIEKVALFKNGLGFFNATATLPPNAKTVRIGQLPVPAFGTFWVGYPKNLKVRSLITSMADVEVKTPVQSIGQLLQANPGRKVTIRTGSGEQDIVEGVIVKDPAEAEPAEPPNPYFMDVRRRQYDHYGHYPSGVPSPANLLLVKTDKGIVALSAGSILRADFDGGEPNASTMAKQKQPRMRIELEQPAAADEKISLSYLAQGATWAPSYLIDLSDDKTAKFSAHALIINELTDLKNVKLDLVTGFPNIKFGEVLSPIAMSQKLEDFMNSLAAGRSSNRRERGGIMAQQARVMTNAAPYHDSDSPVLPSYSTAAEGMLAEDLFLYPVENFSLRKGETAWIPLFTAEMPYRHIYTWHIDDSIGKEDRRQNDRDKPEILGEEVWHSCRLVNNLKMPLSTAATEFVKNGGVTGQDICYYTAPGAETTIRINRAMNLLAEQAEVELERKRSAAEFYGCRYDLVKVRGELKLKSRLDKPAAVEVGKELSGEVLETAPVSKDVPTAKGLKQVNPKHTLTWEVELKPGEELKISYTYQLYIRN